MRPREKYSAQEGRNAEQVEVSHLQVVEVELDTLGGEPAPSMLGGDHAESDLPALFILKMILSCAQCSASVDRDTVVQGLKQADISLGNTFQVFPNSGSEV